MPAFTAKDVKALRERTSMGMMECKKAMTQADGDVDQAIGLLREWAGGKMDDRGDREASEGAIALAQGDGAAVLVQLTAETDFAAKNDDFVAAAQKIADHALSLPATGDVTEHATDDMKALVEDLRITIKENISLKVIHRLEAEQFGTYVHGNRKSAALVGVTGDADDDLLKGLAMHVTAAVPPVVPAPLAVDKSGLPEADVAAAQQQFVDEAKATGKPEQIAEKIAMGKLNKWVDEQTLTGQIYIRELDAKKPVRDYLPKGTTITGFVRVAVG
ncbi:MAG: translation elongation factor Ts [Planctomycetota bacterium]